MVMKHAFKTPQWDHKGITMDEERLNNESQLFADDIISISNNLGEAKGTIQDLQMLQGKWSDNVVMECILINLR